MFGLLSDLVELTGSVIGVVVGTVVGVSVTVIATTLGISIVLVQQALDAGCESYEDIRRYHDLD